jgi:hypothetical protein
MPTIHSSKAITINKVSKYCMPTVLAVRASARGLAGLAPTSLRNPNQKKIRKIDTLATGSKLRLKNAISCKSIVL